MPKIQEGSQPMSRQPDAAVQAARILAAAMENCFVTRNGNIADAIYSLSHQLKFLGNGDASTRHGAIEAFGMHIGEKLDALTSAISSMADPLSD